MSSAAILAMLAIWICFATIPRQVFSQTILANRMSSFGVANTTDIENKLIIHIDASILSQYTNNSGVYRADKATNYVNNNLVTVSGHTSNSNFPTVTLVHSNVPNNPVYQIDLVRTNGNYLQFNYASTNPNYFADFTAGMTILIGYMSLSANYWERIIDIGNSNIRLARYVLIQFNVFFKLVRLYLHPNLKIVSTQLQRFTVKSMVLLLKMVRFGLRTIEISLASWPNLRVRFNSQEVEL